MKGGEKKEEKEKKKGAEPVEGAVKINCKLKGFGVSVQRSKQERLHEKARERKTSEPGWLKLMGTDLPGLGGPENGKG